MLQYPDNGSRYGSKTKKAHITSMKYIMQLKTLTDTRLPQSVTAFGKTGELRKMRYGWP